MEKIVNNNNNNNKKIPAYCPLKYFLDRNNLNTYKK